MRSGRCTRRRWGSAGSFPVDPELTALDFSAWKLKCDEPLSSFAFKMNLRHYTSVEDQAGYWAHMAYRAGVRPDVLPRGACGASGGGSVGGGDGGGGRGNNHSFLHFDPSAPGGSERWLPVERCRLTPARVACVRF